MTSDAAPALRLRAATEADFEPLLALSIRAMRADLERIGRFDPDRRRARMRAGFNPAAMRVIEVDGAIAGCIALDVAAGGTSLHSFYLDPSIQGRGIGTAVLRQVLSTHADVPCAIEVLKQSPVLRFWQAMGFRPVGETEFDILCERPANLGAAATGG